MLIFWNCTLLWSNSYVVLNVSCTWRFKDYKFSPIVGNTLGLNKHQNQRILAHYLITRYHLCYGYLISIHKSYRELYGKRQNFLTLITFSLYEAKKLHQVKPKKCYLYKHCRFKCSTTFQTGWVVQVKSSYFWHKKSRRSNPEEVLL